MRAHAFIAEVFPATGKLIPECKSIGEWKAPLSDKSVPKEIMTYEQVIAEVKPNSVMIVYEGTLDTKSLSLVTSILGDTPHVVSVTKNYLLNCIYQPSKKESYARF